MKTGLLPLDSRPCTFDFPRQLAAAAGYELREPPLEIMDHFQEGSRHRAVLRWIREAAADCDVLVVSVDQFLYGGLIASRRGGLRADTALSRLRLLEDLKAEHPRLRIFAFNVLMRTTVSTLNRESKIWWEKVFQYSEAAYTALRPAGAGEAETLREAAKRAAALKEEIPRAVLAEFLEVRRRNHRVNMASLDLAGRGVFERLLILQEDCSPAGLHRTEQELLEGRIRSLGLGDRAWLHNGTDEAASELTILALKEDGRRAMPVELVWLGGERDFIARYEDRPFRENLASHFRLMNLSPLAGGAPGGSGDGGIPPRLFVYPPRGAQKDHCRAESPGGPDYGDAELEGFAGEIARSAGEGRRPYLLDLAYANGGDFRLLKTLAARMPLRELGGYAAWNTASNSLGTLVSQIAASEIRENSRENRRFTAARLLDDLFYQALVRRPFEDRLHEKGEDPWAIRDTVLAQSLLDEEVLKLRPLADSLLGSRRLPFELRLRWPRSFETAVDIPGEVWT